MSYLKLVVDLKPPNLLSWLWHAVYKKQFANRVASLWAGKKYNRL